MELKHGYTMADLDRATRMALRRNVGWNAFTQSERYEIAWSGIALALYEADEPPTMSDLASAGWYAIGEARVTEMRHHGIDSTHNIGEIRPHFDRYWSWAARPIASPENAIVEKVALYQIWPLLTPQQKQSLSALAVHGSAKLAAAALGKSFSAFHQSAHLGRHRFMEHWHEGETIPARNYRDRRRADADDTDARESYRSRRRAMARRQRGTDYDVRHVRAWAIENGFDLPARGRLPRSVTDAYKKAHPLADGPGAGKTGDAA